MGDLLYTGFYSTILSPTSSPKPLLEYPLQFDPPRYKPPPLELVRLQVGIINASNKNFDW